LNNIRHEASRHFRNKRREYVEDKTNKLPTNIKNKNIRDVHRRIYEFQRGYQPVINLVKDENGGLLPDSHILNRWKNYYFQLLNVQRVSNVRQMKIHTPELLARDHSTFEVEIAITNLKSINHQAVIKFWQN
jgi:hypothetical protein